MVKAKHGQTDKYPFLSSLKYKLACIDPQNRKGTKVETIPCQYPRYWSEWKEFKSMGNHWVCWNSNTIISLLLILMSLNATSCSIWFKSTKLAMANWSLTCGIIFISHLYTMIKIILFMTMCSDIIITGVIILLANLKFILSLMVIILLTTIIIIIIIIKPEIVINKWIKKLLVRKLSRRIFRQMGMVKRKRVIEGTLFSLGLFWLHQQGKCMG